MLVILGRILGIDREEMWSVDGLGVEVVWWCYFT
jgi:hypothetical protein